MTRQEFLRAIIAGLCISVGCVVYLAVDNKVAGAVLFSVGLLSIIKYKLNLFTGKIGLAKDFKEIGKCIGYLVGNAVGCGITYVLLSCTGVFTKINQPLASLAAKKITQNPLQLVILGAMCGILMLFATKEKDHPLLTVLCVAVFILAGFEHSVADAFYLFGQTDILTYLKTIGLIALGNGLGALCVNAVLDDRI